MARILPSGRVFGEASPLPSIQFAKQDHPLKTLQDAATSDLANMAVAGISRIKDEIDYADRVHAEKSRVAGAQIAERKAEAALKALQEQQAAREARLAEIEEARRAEEIRATVAASPIAQVLEGADMARFMSPITPRRAHPQSERGVPIEPLDISPEVRGVYADVFSSDLMRQAGLTPEPVVEPLEQERVMDFSPPDVIEAMEPPPAAITPEQLAEAQARLAAAQKAAAVPMQFVPKTIADFRFKVRDLETRLLQAETAEEKQSLANQIRQTISQARGAVDVQPKDLMEAFTGEAGKGAQKTAYDEMTTTEKEFLRQMYDASKEKRAVAAEKRAESREARAQAKHDADMERADKKARARARALARGGSGKQAALIGVGNNYLKHKKAYKSKSGMFSHEAIEARAGQSLAPEDAELMRQEIWKGLTTLPTGESVSGETTASLASGLRSLGLPAKEIRILAPGISLVGRREDATARADRAKAIRQERLEQVRNRPWPGDAVARRRIAKLEGDNERTRREHNGPPPEGSDAYGPYYGNLAEIGHLQSQLNQRGAQGTTAPQETQDTADELVTRQGVAFSVHP